MRTILKSIGMGLAASVLSIAAGCGAPANEADDLDLSRLPIASEQDAQTDGKFVWARPGTQMVNCIKAPCPSYMLHEVNTGNTELAYAYDWRALKLGPEQQVKITEKPSQLLVRGRYAVYFIDDQPLKVFQVTRANQQVGSAADDPQMDKYYAVRAGNQSCELPPCPPLSAVLLNVAINQPEQWSGLDLSQLGLGQEEQQVVIADIQSGDGYVSTHNASEMPVVASGAFHQYVAATPQQ